MKRQIMLLLSLTLTSLLLLPYSNTAQRAEKDKREFYQFTIYHYSSFEQERVLDNHFQQALIPALHKMGIKNVGVFKPLSNDTATAKSVYVFVPASSLRKLITIPGKLAEDTVYQNAGAVYINAVHTVPPYSRIETILMQAFPMAPVMKSPALQSDKKLRVYELRSYESATEKIFRNKVHMFNEGDEIGLFSKLNFNAIFYSEVIAGGKMPNLMYMTSFENMADRDAHWKSFGGDTNWKKLSSMPEYQNNVSHIDVTFLRPADYSDF